MSNFDSIKTDRLLFLDIGNTSIKGAIKKDNFFEPLQPQGVQNASELVQWIERNKSRFEGAVLASVRKEVTEALQHEFPSLPLKVLTIDDIPAENLNYETPETLGIDRFLSCYGSMAQSQKSVVVIDAGTACTIDFMSQEEVYMGGVIVPGIRGYSELLNQKAPALPEVPFGIPEEWPGKNTTDALKWGISAFYRDGLRTALRRYESEMGDFDLFITGGDAQLIQELLDVDCKLRPMLVFEGMERLLS